MYFCADMATPIASKELAKSPCQSCHYCFVHQPSIWNHTCTTCTENIENISSCTPSFAPLLKQLGSSHADLFSYFLGHGSHGSCAAQNLDGWPMSLDQHAIIQIHLISHLFILVHLVHLVHKKNMVDPFSLKHLSIHWVDNPQKPWFARTLLQHSHPCITRKHVFFVADCFLSTPET